ncbi:hypothetical protein [Novosphingobium sp. Rr 2-17]|uniref:hypothetical protein n=1 Tax=Novosphingobium sp. Rr 2-17 TaxID=555793 RepID=UPI0012F67462|nr:hypothetical protein [Novosphingobium sp. Rr 2-17]
MNNQIALKILAEQLHTLEQREMSLTRELTALQVDIESLRESMAALGDPGTPPILLCPSYEAHKANPYTRICLFSGIAGEVRIMASKCPIEYAINTAAKDIGEIDPKRSAVFGFVNESKARAISGVLKNRIKGWATSTTHVFEAPAFDYLVAGMLSAAECLNVADFDLFETPAPTFPEIPEGAPFTDWIDVTEWAFDQFDEASGHGAGKEQGMCDEFNYRPAVEADALRHDLRQLLRQAG